MCVGSKWTEARALNCTVHTREKGLLVVAYTRPKGQRKVRALVDVTHKHQFGVFVLAFVYVRIALSMLLVYMGAAPFLCERVATHCGLGVFCARELGCVSFVEGRDGTTHP